MAFFDNAVGRAVAATPDGATRKQQLVDALHNGDGNIFQRFDAIKNTGVSGMGPGGVQPPPVSAPASGGDKIPALAMYDTSGMSQAQRDQMAADTASRHARDQAGFDRDQAYLRSRGGLGPEAGYQFYKPEGADPSAGDYGGRLIGGSLFDQQQAAAGAAGSAQQAGSQGGLGAFAGRLEGFDTGKLNDANHNSPKYMIGRALSQFDPRQGVTPDVLAALNKLGIGEFSGSGDKVTIKNGDPRFEGVNAIDLVRGFKDPNGTGGWQFGAEGGPAAAPAAGGGRAVAPAMAGGIQLPGMLGGDPNASIQAALSNIGGLANTNRIQQLIAALQGGGA